MNNVRWYVQQRAESLAVVFLTREPGVEVSKEQGLDFGLNYKLILDRDDASEWVGVQLQAVDAAPPSHIPWRRPGLSQKYFDRLEVPLLLLVVYYRPQVKRGRPDHLWVLALAGRQASS